MRRQVSPWSTALLLMAIIMASSLCLTSVPGAALASSAPPLPRRGEAARTWDARNLSRQITVSFEEPELVLDEKGRIEGFSLPGCELIAISGLPLLPVKVLTFKFDIGLEPVSVRVELGDIEEVPLRYELTCVSHPMPASRHERALPARGSPSHGAPGLLPERWYEYEVHHGIDVLDMARKTFLFVRIYPVRLDVAHKRALFLDSAHVAVEVSGSPIRRAMEGPGADMLIITSEDLLPAAEYLASYRNDSGITTIIRTVEWITANYDGRDEPEKIRNCVKELVDELGIIFVLILGDHDVVPARLVYIPDGYADDNDAEDGSYVETDLYYADLDWTWDDNNDGRWGDLDHDNVDGVPDVFVGRLPASSLSEAWVLVGKIQVYESSSLDAPWLRRAVFIGTDLFTGTGYEGPEGEILKDHIDYTYVPVGTTVTKLYETEGTLSPSAVLSAINSGCGFVNFAGHGVSSAWSLGSGGTFTTGHVSALDNGEKLCFVATAACLTSRFSDRDCIGERFLLKSDGGAIVYFGCTRVAWMRGDGDVAYDLAGRMDAFFAEAYFTGVPTPGQIWAYAVEHYIALFSIKTLVEDHYLHWKTVAEYGAPFGDPSVCVQGRPTGAYQLQVVCYDADGETPIEGVEVELEFLAVLRLSDTTGEDGSVLFENLLPGHYTLRATYMGVTVAEREVILPGEETIALNCSLYDLTITCTDAGGEPLADALVEFYLDDTRVFQGTTGPSGRLRAEDIPAATYGVHVVWLRPRAEEAYSGFISLQEDEQVATLQCAIYDVVVEVIDLLGRPVEGAAVQLYTEDGALVDSSTTGPDGRAEIEDILEGIYRAVVSAELAEPEEAIFTVSRPGIVITITLSRLLSPAELYTAVGVGGGVLIAAIAYAVYRRRKRRFPAYWYLPKKGYPYRGPAPPRGFG